MHNSKMNLERYILKAEESLMVFEFISEGPNGRIPKLVKFSETNLKDFIIFSTAWESQSI